MTEDGKVQKISYATGCVLAESPDLQDAVKKSSIVSLKEEQAIDMRFIYNEVYGHLIVEKIIEGESLAKICALPGMPSIATLAKWRARHADFDHAIDKAFELRAERAHDKIMDSVEDEGILSKEMVAGAQHKFNKLKWLAAVGNPDRYGQKTTVRGDKKAPLAVYMIDTGIRREQASEDVIEVKPEPQEIENGQA